MVDIFVEIQQILHRWLNNTHTIYWFKAEKSCVSMLKKLEYI